MNSRSISALAIAGLFLGMTAAAMPAEADTPARTPAENAASKPAAGAPIFPGLGELRTIEVRSFEPQEYSARRGDVPPELSEYARSAVQNDTRLRYNAPGDGLLRFSCEGWLCRRIRAEVTLGEDGPIVWQTERIYHKFLSVTDPDNREFANQIVKQLGADYDRSLKAVPMKIQIRED